MTTTLPVGCTALFAVATLFAIQDPAPPEPPKGHVVLVVEGDATQLRITHAVPKPDPWAGVPRGLQSEFALLAVDQRGEVLARVPIDVSKFDTDPARTGGPVVVNGCEVRSPRIAVLVNIPFVPQASRYDLVRGKQVLGSTTAATLGELQRRPR